jgi:hypothetical protein
MRSAAERASWVALFERSGKDVKSFCRENELIPVGSVGASTSAMSKIYA